MSEINQAAQKKQMSLRLTGYQLLKVDRASRNYDITLVATNAEAAKLRQHEAVKGRKWKRFDTLKVKGWVTPNETAPEYMIVRVERRITVNINSGQDQENTVSDRTDSK